MPLTPAHVGPVLLYGGLGGKKLNLLVLILAVTVIDIEVFFLGIAGDRYYFAYHGFFHTVLGAGVYAIILALIVFLFYVLKIKLDDMRYNHSELYEKFRDYKIHNWTWSFKCVLLSSFIGAYSHVALDWLLYDNIYVFIGSDLNFYFLITENIMDTVVNIVYIFCAFGFIIGLALYIWRYINRINKEYTVESIYNLKFHGKDLWTFFAVMLTPFTMAGIVYIIAFNIILIFHSPLNLEASAVTAHGLPLYLASNVIVVLHVFLFLKSLREVGWKLME